jgi:ribosomal protein S18 acetylase RimI-like enzyme
MNAWAFLVSFQLMQIRPATALDVPAVLPMVRKICALHKAWDKAKYDFKPEPERRYERWLIARADDRRSVFLVADENGKLFSFLIGTVEQEIPIYNLTEFGFIHDLWVEEDYRHEGIGRQLTMAAIEKFAAIGVKQIRLDTAAANDAARELFAACGFRPSVTEMLIELENNNG